jgi:hypothetical protein
MFVDFRWNSASFHSNVKMVMSQLNKTLAILGMLLFFVLGGFAVSFAHDLPPPGTYQTKQLRRTLKHGPAQVDGYTLRVGMDSETGALPNSSQPVLQEFQLIYAQLLEPVGDPVLTQIHAAKVSRHILDSVLLL